ncbi:MAG TPA: hypothetical protein VMR52_02570 [Dehalococcoidia bacterium]|nr:hypothetical protein [Dehalococcoidia bacterium]
MNSALLARRRFGRSVARFILLGVLLPNVVYLGHWGVGTSDAAQEAAHHESHGADEHDLHCHAGPAKCAGAQATVGSININEDSGLVTPEGTIRPTLDAPAEFAPEPPSSRLLQPPQAA